MKYTSQLTDLKVNLNQIVVAACKFVNDNIAWKLSQHDVSEYIQSQIALRGIKYTQRPNVKFYGVNMENESPFTTIRRAGWLSIAITSGGDSPLHIGWWCKLGALPTDAEVTLHRQLFEYAESARYVDGALTPTKHLTQMSDFDLLKHDIQLLTEKTAVQTADYVTHSMSLLSRFDYSVIGLDCTFVTNLEQSQQTDFFAVDTILHIPASNSA